jgi:hypothetical protein
MSFHSFLQLSLQKKLIVNQAFRSLLIEEEKVRLIGCFEIKHEHLHLITKFKIDETKNTEGIINLLYISDIYYDKSSK